MTTEQDSASIAPNKVAIDKGLLWSEAERVNARETGEKRILCCHRGAERRSA